MLAPSQSQQGNPTMHSVLPWAAAAHLLGDLVARHGELKALELHHQHVGGHVDGNALHCAHALLLLGALVLVGAVQHLACRRAARQGFLLDLNARSARWMGRTHRPRVGRRQAGMVAWGATHFPENEPVCSTKKDAQKEADPALQPRPPTAPLPTCSEAL